jgi:TrmH family RNA methyltransferase
MQRVQEGQGFVGSRYGYFNNNRDIYIIIFVRSWKDNVFFILVETKEPGNVGASARALKNMGFKNLEMVNPVYHVTGEDRFMACNAIDLLERAAIYPTLKEAVTGKSLVIGTTRRLGRRRGLILPLKESIKRIMTAAKRNNIAILFGREDKGLNNKEVEECGFLITIPTDSLSPSLNLAQSVLLVAYELSQTFYSGTSPVLVKHAELEKFYHYVNSILRLLEYIPRGDRDIETKIMRNLKHLIGRAGLTDWELRMFYGICEQLKKRIKLKNK